VVQRTACWLQASLSDRSALFTFFALRLQRNPWLIQFLYGLGSPEDEIHPDRPRQASLVPLAAQPETKDRRQAAYTLTSALIGALAREVTRSGADFLLLMTDAEFEKLDVAKLRSEGVVNHQLEIRGPAQIQREIRFVNDSHYNRRGHYLAARLLAPLVEQTLRERLRRARPR
jgi:hypothetical protein